jgi:hypothetical protein
MAQLKKTEMKVYLKFSENGVTQSFLFKNHILKNGSLCLWVDRL